jgi:hypothetical protein
MLNGVKHLTEGALYCAAPQYAAMRRGEAHNGTADALRGSGRWLLSGVRVVSASAALADGRG